MGDKYLEEMTAFFKDLKKCTIHPNCQCTYLGSIEERLKKYKELRERTTPLSIAVSEPNSYNNPYGLPPHLKHLA